MAKEKYKDALTGAFNQFITPPTPAAPIQPPETDATRENTKQRTATAETWNEVTQEEREKRKERAKHNAKFIGTAPASRRAATDTKNPRGRRVQLLFRPNVHAELLAIAHAQGRSLNNLIEEVLTNYINGVHNK